jgi:glycosyltransferase involved in cell wall biosynthesis
MNVYFTNSMLEACWFVRCYVPMCAGGWDGDRTSILKNYRAPNVMAAHALEAMQQSDVIVFHRPNDDRAYNVALELRRLGKKIVYDNDDTYKNFTGLEQHLTKKLEYVDKWTDKFIKMADFVTCSTEFLAEEYRKLNKKVVVLPNCVEPLDWPNEPQRNTNGKVRIGIVGSAAANQDFEPIADILPKLCERGDVEVVMFGLPAKTNPKVMRLYKNDYAFWDKLKIEWHPFVTIQEYIDKLDSLKLDLMLIPRHDDYFNRCKSNLKFLEASMLEIPVIAQGFEDGKSPYQVNPQDTQRMVVITDNTKWEETIEKFIQNKQMREDIGKRAKEYVLENYDINNKIQLWENAYRNLLS